MESGCTAMKKIRVAHFGIAHDHSEFTLECALKYPDIFEVVGICEPDEAMRREFGSKEIYKGIPWISEEELLGEKEALKVTRYGNVFTVEAEWLRRIMRGILFDDSESLQYFQRVLRITGVISRLVEEGVQEGDLVSIYDFEFEFVY